MADTAILIITEPARDKVLEVRAGEPDADAQALWLEVSGVQGNAYTYDMYFRPLDEAEADSIVERHDELPLVLPAGTVDKVRGSTLDLTGTGMVLRNPNTPPPPAPLPKGDLTGDLAQRVLAVLDEQVNPAIASHGGQAELMAVEGSIAFLRLSGGCQGCGMAAATLKQGIEVAILEAVPEISEVVDVTDHAGGTNPYYAAQ